MLWAFVLCALFVALMWFIVWLAGRPKTDVEIIDVVVKPEEEDK